MPKSGGAAIPMPFSFNGLQYAVGTPETVEGMRTLKAMQPFDDAVIAFLNDLSGELRKVREYPDAATFGFWCRKAALTQEKAKSRRRTCGSERALCSIPRRRTFR